MKNLFNSVKVLNPKSNYFDLTHDVKMTGIGGTLMPCYLEEVMPGDKFKIGADMMVRCAPMIAPVMHRIDAYIHYFFVPNRIIWDNWELFITGGENDGHPEPVMPYFDINHSTTPNFIKLADYLGIPPPPSGAVTTRINALPFAAYNKIFNDYYRDQNLMNEALDKLVDGANTPANFIVRNRCWEHDYFTACLPWAQKGAPVSLPVSDPKLNSEWSAASAPYPHFEKDDGSTPDANLANAHASGNPYINGGDGAPEAYNPEGSLTNEVGTINDLRRAMALQRWLEKMARGGSRYVELLKNMFNVNSSDARLQRAEYITGCKAPIVISEVLNTAGISGELPQGNMAGHGVSLTDGTVGEYYAEEHGYIMGIVSILPKPAYQDGIPRTFSKFDRFDYPWPDFAHIGEQEVKQQELYAYSNNKDKVFGYIPRYAEYKYHPSRSAGEFRTSLDYWTLTRKFDFEVTGEIPLNEDFVRADQADFNRIFAVTDPSAAQFYMHVLNKVGVHRKLPKYGNPI